MYFLLDYCDNFKPVIKLVASVVKLIQFGVPILLIVFGMIEFR